MVMFLLMELEIKSSKGGVVVPAGLRRSGPSCVRGAPLLQGWLEAMRWKVGGGGPEDTVAPLSPRPPAAAPPASWLPSPADWEKPV